MKKIILIAVILMAGCSSTIQPIEPDTRPFDASGYGPPPENYENAIKQLMGQVLFDPYSAVFNFSTPPKQGWFVGGDPFRYGYIVCAQINAKNRMGGYSGQKTYMYFFENGKLTDYTGFEDLLARRDLRGLDPLKLAVGLSKQC